MSYLELDTAKIHYQLIGPKDPSEITSPLVIFLHGMVMDNLSSWFFTVANPVAQFAPTVVYDLRGHGFSDRPATGYFLEDHVSDLKSLVDKVSPDAPVILVGNSFGGLVAINYAAQFADRVVGLVLVDAQVNDEAWKAQMLATFGLEGAEQDAMIEENFKNWLGRTSTRRSSRLATIANALLYKTSLIDDLAAAPLLTDEDLAGIKAPCFAIYGGQSDILDTAYRLRDVVPNSELRIVEHCTHSVLWEETELVKAWILESIHSAAETYKADQTSESLFIPHAPVAQPATWGVQ